MKDSICESEKRRLNKLNKFQLSHKFKKIGWSLFAITFLLMIARKLFDIEPSWIKPLLKNVMIFSLLLVSLAKDKIEDEMIEKLRAQSYRLAFIIGVFYSFTLPYIGYAVDFLLGKEDVALDNDYFTIMLSMLAVQIMFFATLKRAH